jgi:hypothetical protein
MQWVKVRQMAVWSKTRDPTLGLRLPQQQDTAIAGGRATVKICFNLSAHDAAKDRVVCELSIAGSSFLVVVCCSPKLG